MLKYRFHIVIVLILLVVALLLYRNSGRSTLGLNAGAIATSADRITAITIAGSGSEVSLVRVNEDQWNLNSVYEPSRSAVKMLLQTLSRLRISGPAPQSVSLLFNDDLRIDIHEGRRVRTIFVYSSGPGEPTYMRLSGDSRIWEVEAVGFVGHVASLFVADESYWRSNILFGFKPADIEEIIVVYPGEAEKSFILRQSADRQVILFRYPDASHPEGVGDSLAARYFSGFMHVPFERFAGTGEKTLLDSLKNARPDYLISVKRRDGEVTRASLHRIITGTTGSDDDPGFDIFRLHALVNDGNDMVIVTWQMVDLLLRSYSYFHHDKK
jgi:hypothetical protein